MAKNKTREFTPKSDPTAGKRNKSPQPQPFNPYNDRAFNDVTPSKGGNTRQKMSREGKDAERYRRLKQQAKGGGDAAAAAAIAGMPH